MCGIFGYIGNIPEEYHGTAFRLATKIFIESKSRGRDASGFAALKYGDPALLTEKRNIVSEKFVERSTKWRSVVRRLMPNILIGHTRASTSGDPRMGRNNHPFHSKRYSMVHNGKVFEWEETAKKLGINLRSQTDSEILLKIIDRHENPKTGIKSIIESLNSNSDIAIAFLNHGEKNKKLNVFTNGGRPINFMLVGAWEAVFFASTKQILEWAIDGTAGGYAYREEWKRQHDVKFESATPYHLYQLYHKNDELIIDNEEYERPQPITTTSVPVRTLPVNGQNTSISNGNKARADYKNKTASASAGGRVIIANNEMIEALNNRTKKEVQEIQITLDESVKVCASIQNNKHMTEEEYISFMKWMLEV